MISGIKIYKTFNGIYLEFLGNTLLHVKHSDVSGLNRYLFYPRKDYTCDKYTLVRYYKKVYHKVDPVYVPVIRLGSLDKFKLGRLNNYFLGLELEDVIDWKVFMSKLIDLDKNAYGGCGSISFRFSPIPWLLENVDGYYSADQGIQSIKNIKCNICIERKYDFEFCWWDKFAGNILQEFLISYCFNQETTSYVNQGDLLINRWSVTTFHI